jgi:hypothetical protein
VGSFLASFALKVLSIVYARPDAFRLHVNEQPQPVVVRSAFAPGEG